jgi:hypothetical protein
LLVDRFKHPILILFFSFSKNKYCFCESLNFEWFAKLRVFLMSNGAAAVVGVQPDFLAGKDAKLC